MNDCIFCKIASGQIGKELIYEDRDVVAFPDLGQIRRGHSQIVTRRHIETFEDLPPDLAAHVLHVGQQIARIQKRLYGVDRVAFLFSGGDIPHVHAHLVPMVEKTDITSARYIAETDLTFRALPEMSEAELAEIAHEMRSAMQLEPTIKGATT
ncbi:MAG: HIT family protein [Pseudomonadota bacterium]